MPPKVQEQAVVSRPSPTTQFEVLMLRHFRNDAIFIFPLPPKILLASASTATSKISFNFTCHSSSPSLAPSMPVYPARRTEQQKLCERKKMTIKVTHKRSCGRKAAVANTASFPVMASEPCKGTPHSTKAQQDIYCPTPSCMIPFPSYMFVGLFGLAAAKYRLSSS